MEKNIFNKSYSAESLCDVEQDIYESLNSKYNPIMEQIPVDECGFASGTFKVTVVWVPDE